MKRQNRLTARMQAREQETTEHQAQQQSAREFTSVEEMLRHDALHTPVPPAVAYRLQQSTVRLQPPATSWWRRVFRTPRKK